MAWQVISIQRQTKITKTIFKNVKHADFVMKKKDTENLLRYFL